MNISKSKMRDIIQSDIQRFLDNDGTIIVAKQRKKHKLTTFRNNRYSVFNMGAKCNNLRNMGIYANMGA